MAATKTARTLVSSQANAAAGTTTGTEWDLTTKYGGIIAARITNGATGPTVGCDFVVYVGSVTGEKREFSRQTAPTANAAATDFVVEAPPGAMFVNVTFTGNTVQGVTVEAIAEELTSI